MDDLDLDGQKRPGPAEQIEGALPDSKLKIIRSLLENIKASTQAIEKMLSGDLPEDLLLERIRAAQVPGPESDPQAAGRIIEGVFDGENMIGPDGKQYSVPANYASKSKLVEGDILKLTITATGTSSSQSVSATPTASPLGSHSTAQASSERCIRVCAHST